MGIMLTVNLDFFLDSVVVVIILLHLVEVQKVLKEKFGLYQLLISHGESFQSTDC